jgi:hypothetical protein
MLDITDPSIVTMDELFQAKDFKVQLWLTNGESVLVPIDLQEASFRKFVSACNSAFPAPKKPEPESTVAISPDDFQSQLQMTLQNRAAGLQIKLSDFDRTLQSINHIVHLCATIPASEFAAQNDQIAYANWNSSYSACGPTNWVADHGWKHGIRMNMDLNRYWDRNGKTWQYAKFRIELYVQDAPGPQRLPRFDDPKVLLLSADINPSQSVGSLNPDRSAAPAILKVSAEDQATKQTRRVLPELPEIARRSNVSGGLVTFRATINVDGTVRNLLLIEGNPLLVDSARKAIMQWRYQPTFQTDGSPVVVDTEIKVYVGHPNVRFHTPQHN